MALPLVVKSEVRGLEQPKVLKAVDAAEFAANGWPIQRSALLLRTTPQPEWTALLQLPWGAVIAEDPSAIATELPVAEHPLPYESVSPGDIIELTPGKRMLRVVYRRGDRGNVIFATERCSSFCLMCSQPPREVNDEWRVKQNVDLVSLIDRDEPSLAITGGEPTLLGQGLVRVIAACAKELPNTDLQILTNGRHFTGTTLAVDAAAVGHPKLQWNVPLYADVAPLHDYVVQAKGAFHQTIEGLYKLGEARQRVEIRVVLHKPTIPRLKALGHFIYRNLSFVSHIALMGIEPIGFARGNREALWIDPLDYQRELEDTVHFLRDRGMAVSVYNLPLCVLPRTLWPAAAQSISDWKNIYLEACQSCAAKPRCAGFFQSTSKEWVSRGIQPIRA